VSPRYPSEIAGLSKKEQEKGVAFPDSCLLMFVENAKEQEVLLLFSWFIIVNDKMLTYAFILTHEGYPCACSGRIITKGDWARRSTRAETRPL
jgi:hypothetical protein